jgi:hypothetical protein
METKESFMARCTNDLITAGKSSRQANASCEIAWNRLRKSEGMRRSDFIRDVRDDGIDFSDALILAGLAYMWLSDGSESYSSRESYDQSTPTVDTDPDYSNSYSSSDLESSDYSSSSSDYSSSSYDSGGSFSSSD